MTEIEQRLLRALKALNEHVGVLEGRLENMTENYRVLSQRMQGLEQRLSNSEKERSALLKALESSAASQRKLREQLSELSILLNK